MREMAADLDIAYTTAIDHRDRLTEAGKIRQIRRVKDNMGVFEVICPEGAEAERGVDRALVVDPPKVIRWS